MNKSGKIVYVAMSFDILHKGHFLLLQRAAELGRVVVGLLTDEAMAAYQQPPLLTFVERLDAVISLANIGEVIPQYSLDYTENLRKVRPDFFVHGDDWIDGTEGETREAAINVLSEWGGILKEFPHTKGISSTELRERLLSHSNPSFDRVSSLRSLLNAKDYLRFIDVHSGLSGVVIENASSTRNGETVSFDGMWSSSLVDSTVRAMPDNESVDVSARLNGLQQVLDVTTKPIIFDGDTGGKIEHFVPNLRALERNGISAVIIEDKVGLKRNSLFGNEVPQTLDDPHAFGEKITAGVQARRNQDFMVIARIESLIVDMGLDDALRRAEIYLDAGADGIMIHSRKKDPQEIFDFAGEFNKWKTGKPLVLVPTAFNNVREDELHDHGARILIHANHILRASYPAMLRTAQSILENGRTAEITPELMPISEILNFVPGT
ncbi:phosphoenolpyruvate mutase [Actinomycetota bacterium]|nr:phosphoenolpyruvate mutase [Actinomycetota bacterium]